MNRRRISNAKGSLWLAIVTVSSVLVACSDSEETSGANHGGTAGAAGSADAGGAAGAGATAGSAGAGATAGSAGAGATAGSAGTGATGGGGAAGGAGAAGAGGGEQPACTGDLFLDSFESGDMSATNSDGFSWANNNRTSVVTMNPEPVAVWNNGPIQNPGPEGADWTAYDGDYSLRFRYPAGEFWSEQRFDLGAPQPELWIRYWLRVPTNFKHGHTKPTNNKFFALWMDGYSQHGDGPTIVWNFWRQDETDNSRFTFSVAETGEASGGHHADYPNFIRSPEDQGRWMQVVLYAKMATDAESMDGESRIYRRWEDEDAFTLIGETTGKNFSAPAGGPNGWHAGYIMGWSNPAYDEDTEWLLDAFELSTTPLNCK